MASSTGRQLSLRMFDRPLGSLHWGDLLGLWGLPNSPPVNPHRSPYHLNLI
jgi:hypothetical protein